ncbi:MAG: YitT family protein [Blautia sp.]|nr:YitT family protein [Blautia sp.]MDY5030520.1 YitT family protein [Blautia sp.]
MKRKKTWYTDYLLILAGTLLMAVAIGSVFDMSGMVTGGFSGLAIIIKSWTGKFVLGGIPLWVTNLFLNVPLFLLGAKIGGFGMVRKALWGSICLTVWLAVIPTHPLAGEDLLLAAIYGGILQGTGIGLVFLGGGTTGGTDMMAALIQKYLRHYSVAQIMQLIDGSIVLIGICVFGINKALYAIIAVYMTTKISDGLIEGLKFAKQVYIISDSAQEIAKRIMGDLNRGVTGIKARGMYYNREKEMLYCVVNKKELVELKELVSEMDPGAFMIVSDAREVHGEGFIEKN